MATETAPRCHQGGALVGSQIRIPGAQIGFRLLNSISAPTRTVPPTTRTAMAGANKTTSPRAVGSHSLRSPGRWASRLNCSFARTIPSWTTDGAPSGAVPRPRWRRDPHCGCRTDTGRNLSGEENPVALVAMEMGGTPIAWALKTVYADDIIHECALNV